MSPGREEWRVVHPNGYVTPATSEPPSETPRWASGAIAVAVDHDTRVVTRVMEFTSRKWNKLTGNDREFALDWLERAVANRKRGG